MLFMLVVSDFDYYENKDALDTILYDPLTSGMGQNWIHRSHISEVKICVEQSMHNRCGIYPSFRKCFLCSLIRKNTLDNNFPIQLRSRENEILKFLAENFHLHDRERDGPIAPYQQ